MLASLDSLEQRRLFATNLLLNGDFETPAIGVGTSGQSFTTVPAGSSLISHWKVSAGSVDIVSNAGVGFSTKPASGKQLIDMDGTAPGTLTQSAPTIAGHRYLLRFAWTATPFNISPNPTTRKLDVQFAGHTIASLSKSVVGETPTNPGWKFSEFLLTATSSSSAVTFIAKSTGNLGMAIDAVSLTEVPFGTASISGQVFADGNGDGIKGTDAIGLSAWTVFIDTNGNGKLDTNELSATTDHFGKYSFKNLAAGTYKLRVVQQTGWKLTTPSIVSVTLATGQQSMNKLFGEQPV